LSRYITPAKPLARSNTPHAVSQSARGARQMLPAGESMSLRSISLSYVLTEATASE
jgi:hypothetical protein